MRKDHKIEFHKIETVIFHEIENNVVHKVKSSYKIHKIGKPLGRKELFWVFFKLILI